MKEILADLNEGEIAAVMRSMGELPYRAKQLFSGIHAGKAVGEMSDIPKALREKLALRFEERAASIIKTVQSADGTRKFLFALADGNVVEGVLMKYKYGNTLCVSTQVGCRMGCRFCASTLGGLVRNMTAGEILSQVLAVNALEGGTAKDRAVTNVVLMGSGEPLDNYENTLKFLRLLGAPGGINISARNVSLSTCGLADKVKIFAEEKIPVNLTVSLHSPFDAERAEIMPVTKRFTVSEILAACSYYFEKTGRRYIFEYSLIKGKNDGERHARELIRILKGRPCHVNLIRLNEVAETGLSATDDKSAYSFLEKLKDGGLSATLRRRMGADIEGACGQLRRKFIGESH